MLSKLSLFVFISTLVTASFAEVTCLGNATLGLESKHVPVSDFFSVLKDLSNTREVQRLIFLKRYSSIEEGLYKFDIALLRNDDSSVECNGNLAHTKERLIAEVSRLGAVISSDHLTPNLVWIPGGFQGRRPIRFEFVPQELTPNSLETFFRRVMSVDHVSDIVPSYFIFTNTGDDLLNNPIGQITCHYHLQNDSSLCDEFGRTLVQGLSGIRLLEPSL